MRIVLAFTIAALVTYLLRIAMTVVGAQRSAGLQVAVAAVTPCVLAGMVASALFVHNGTVGLPTLAEVSALGIGYAVARRTGNISLALAVGLPVHWLASTVFGGI